MVRETVRLIALLLPVNRTYLSDCQEKRSAYFAPHYCKRRKTLIF
jgi:hypothetical protein